MAAGNSKTGMDSVKAGEALAITYQSAEGDGALAVHSAARWFSGETLEPVVYLPKHMITRGDVDQSCRRSGRMAGHCISTRHCEYNTRRSAGMD